MHLADYQKIMRSLDLLEKFSSELVKRGYQIWSRRISFPIAKDNIFRVCDYIHSNYELLSRYFIAAFIIDPRESNIPSGIDLFACMINLKNTFSTILVAEDYIDKVLGFMKQFYSTEQYDVYTRFAGVVGEWVMTPYFPSSPSLVGEDTMTIALRYIDLFDKGFSGGGGYRELINWLRELDSSAREIAESIGLGYGGIDASLSPWMEESVAELVEKYSGETIDSPGVAYTIYRMNRFIDEIISVSGIRRIGFNEVMLPVEEDNLLKKRVAEGRLTLTKLLRLTPYCIVGVDMIVVPRRRFSLDKFILDLLTVYRIKRKPLGFRVIPVDKEPGSVIDLGRFGSAVVADI